MTDNIPLMEKKRPNMGDYVRSGSCLGEPQTNALSCLREKDLLMFTDAVNIGIDDVERQDGFGKLPPDHWINRPIESENCYTLLTIALMDDLKEFVDVLLSAGADASLLNPKRGFEAPIHVAAMHAASHSFPLLFRDKRNKADVNACLLASGQSALHLCVEKKFTAGCDVIMEQEDADVDIRDKKGGQGQTPLYLAVKSGQRDVAEKLISYGANYNQECFRKPIIQLINEKMPDLDVDSIKRYRDPVERNSEMETLRSLIQKTSKMESSNPIRQKNFKEFKAIALNTSTQELENTRFSGETLLSKACYGRLAEFVKVLVKDKGVNPNGRSDGGFICPVIIAAQQADVDTLKVLLENDAEMAVTEPVHGDTILHCVLSQSSLDNTERAEKCVKFLLAVDHENEKILRVMKKIINKRGALDNTPLHHASKLWPAWTVRRLLELGANIGMKNHWDEVAISHISPETMEEFLNEHCIRFDSKMDVNHEKFKITLDYSFLAPPNEDLPVEMRQLSSSKVDVEETEKGLVANNDDDLGQHNAGQYPLPETETLWYLSQSKNHRHLLKHPVITSFLWLKWTRIRRFFNRNLRFYMLFVFVLTWHIFERFGGNSIHYNATTNTTVDTDTNTNKNTDYIPLIYGLYVAFFIITVLFILKDWKTDVYDKLRSLDIKALRRKSQTASKICNDDEDNGANEADEEGMSCKLILGIIVGNWMEFFLLVFMGIILIVGTPFLWTALLILIGILTIREVMQMAVSLKRYILEVENWIEIVTIGLAAVILFYNHNESGADDNTDMVRRHLAAIAIVLSWAELITLVGKHPKLTRYNVYVVMFYTVIVTFFFFLLWFALFIVAFGLGFYIMLHKDVDSSGKDEGGSGSDVQPPCCQKDDDEEGNGVFDSPWVALVKTSAMFIGELEFGDFPIDRKSSLSPLSYFFFLCFVFLIVVVLMNLLNGLAVSDTGAIQARAEIVSYTSQVETISYSESLLLGDPFNFLSNWPALKWLKSIPACSIWRPLYRNRIVQSLFNKIFGAKEILLFYNFLPDKTHTIFLNKHSIGLQRCIQVDPMDEDILLSAKTIIADRICSQKAKQEQGTIEALQRQVKDLEEKIQKQGSELNDKLDELLRKLH